MKEVTFVSLLISCDRSKFVKLQFPYTSKQKSNKKPIKWLQNCIQATKKKLKNKSFGVKNEKM